MLQQNINFMNIRLDLLADFMQTEAAERLMLRKIQIY